MINAILFPSDFFDKTTVDEELKNEYTAAWACGKYRNVILFSYYDWFHEGVLKLNFVPDELTVTVYRGWMMQPEQYEHFYHALKEKNIELITTPQEYARFHIFPNAYEAIKEDTPRILLFPKGESVDLEKVKKAFSRFMVKDYLKSVKGTDFPAFFQNDITQEDFDDWMQKFYEYRGGLFTGGICIKEYVNLKMYGKNKNEYRVFYANGEILTVSRNSGQPEYPPLPPVDLIEKYKNLNSCFYTVDFAELTDGRWIVIEVGDGSVSGLSDFQDNREFFRKLWYTFL